MAHRLVGDLRRSNKFLRGTIDNLRKEVLLLREDNKLYKDLVKGKVKVFFDRYDPEKYSGVNKMIDAEALSLCQSTGSWFYWKVLYNRLCAKYRGIDWNPETVRRRCQLAVKEGLLTRVKPGTYIYNIHR